MRYRSFVGGSFQAVASRLSIPLCIPITFYDLVSFVFLFAAPVSWLHRCIPNPKFCISNIYLFPNLFHSKLSTHIEYIAEIHISAVFHFYLSTSFVARVRPICFRSFQSSFPKSRKSKAPHSTSDSRIPQNRSLQTEKSSQ